MINKFRFCGLLLLLSCCFISHAQNLLVFSKTNGFRHKSIEIGQLALDSMARANGFKISFSEDSTDFTRNNLQQYDALIFLSPSGEVFGEMEKNALQYYIRNGGGFIGIHGATTVAYDWPWYGQLIGAYFADHPEVQTARLFKVSNHPSTAHLNKVWDRTDEWYNFRSEVPDHLTVLLTIDETTYEGGKMGTHHPVSWCQEFQGGRSFYTALGHTEDSYRDPDFLQHVLGGIRWACAKD